ncbi:hypothetical protein BH18ACI4_BH18ACI4_13000 [soil metagenome]
MVHCGYAQILAHREIVAWFVIQAALLRLLRYLQNLLST